MKAEESDTDVMFRLPESITARERQGCPICRGSGIRVFHHNTAMVYV
jgi:hypothetical protein